VTPSIGIELPGLDLAEPAYSTALDWLLCDGLARLSDPDGRSLYLRLTTRPIDQRPFAEAAARRGEDRLRAEVLAGGYRLMEPAGPEPADVVLVASGAVLPEVVAAAAALAAEGVSATVVDVTSAGRLFRGWRDSQRAAVASGRRPDTAFHLASLIAPAERRAPVVTVHDAASHALAWVGSVFGQRTVPVGVDAFGQSGSIDDLFGIFGLLPGQIVNAALVALETATPA
jgi:pyruvate dehydrogenase E1 component